MAFFGNLVKLFSRNNHDTPRKRLNPFVRMDTDPLASWENVDVIGDGAFGKVHKAHRKSDNQWAALKEIALESDEDLEDLKVEIDILVSCRHKYIVELLEAYLFENRLWLYLEFCGGGALDSIMQDLCRGLSEPEIRHVCHRVLSALVFLHSRFVIHRDLKAGNILLTTEGVVKLADFGVSAKNTDEKQRRDTFIGTPFWMAPEVIMCETDKDNPYDYRADVWSLGITLIELAEMNPPHHEMHPMRLMIKVQKSPAPELGRPKRWSPEFSAFLKRCLVKDPNQRAKSSDLLADPFISNEKEDDTSLMRQLVLEVHGDYEDTMEEGVSASALHQSNLSLGSLEKLSDTQETESNESERSVAPETANGGVEGSAEKVATAPHIPLESFAEEIYASLLEEVFTSETTAPSFPVVVLDVMTEEFEAMTPTPDAKTAEFDLEVYDKEPGKPKKAKEELQTTDIDTIVVSDNRTVADLPPESENTVRVVSGYGTVSAIVSNSTSALQVRDNREAAASSASASDLANGQGDKEEEAGSKKSGDSLTEAEDKSNTAKMADRRRHSQYRTLTRVRKFVVDGEERTTTTTRVVIEGLETKEKENYADRKAGIREMRLLQKQEQRQHRDLMLRSQGMKTELDQRLRNEEQALKRQYETELEVMQRQHKVQLERAETQHTNEIRYASRRVKTGHERELRKFRDSLKLELKSVRQEVDLQPKDRRKEMLRSRMEEKELEHAERERDFHSELAAQMEAEIARMTVKYRKKLGQMENNFLRLKHNLRRKYEEDCWHMEQSHMYTRHQKAREQLEEYFTLKREQTANKQTVERDHLMAMIAKDKAFLLAAQNAEKKRLPKTLRTESKTRLQMFRQSLRLPGPQNASSPEDERERLRVFEEAERERVRAELDRMARKQAKKLEAMQLSHNAMMRELEQLQAEKKKELMDSETAKMREIDENFQKSMAAFQAGLKERRRVLEEELEEELRRQKEFYTLSDDGPNVQIRELPAELSAPVTDLDSVPVTN